MTGSAPRLERPRPVAAMPWWSLAYVAAVVWPVVAMTVVSVRDSVTTVVAFANAAGFLLFSATALQVVLVFRRGPASCAQRQLLTLHRAVGWSLVPLALLHVGVLVAEDPARLSLLDVRTAPPRALAGILALVALLLIPATTIFRRRIRLSYEWWRWLHLSLTAVLITGAYVHILLVSRFSADPLMRQGLLAFVTVAALALWVLRAAGPFLASRRRRFRLAEVRREVDGCSTLVLEPTNGADFSFSPGQFVWIKDGHRPLAADDHPFSIASSARRRAVEITIREAGDFTASVAELEPGACFILDGPHGGWSLPPRDVPCCLVVGGVGITPAMSLLRTLADDGDTRDVALVVGARRVEDIPFHFELRQLSEHLSLHVTYVISGETSAQVCEAQSTAPAESFTTGFVDARVLLAAAPAAPAASAWYVCGPPPMLDSVQGALASLQVPRSRVHLERYRMA